MYTFLIVLASIIAVFLVIIVLLQSSKGGGLAGTFGGAAGGMGTMFGTRRTADFLSRATWVLAISLAALAVIINLFFLPTAGVTQRESVIQRGGQQNTAPQNPGVPQQQQQTPGAQ